MARDLGQAQILRNAELAPGGVHEPEPGAPLAEPLPEPASWGGPRPAVVVADVGGRVQDPVQPLLGGGPGARQRHHVDLGGGDPELLQQRAHRQARVARVVLEPREALLGRAPDDAPVAEQSGSGAVSLADAEDDHAVAIILGGRRSRARWAALAAQDAALERDTQALAVPAETQGQP